MADHRQDQDHRQERVFFQTVRIVQLIFKIGRVICLRGAWALLKLMKQVRCADCA